jgi:dolichyl-phosphate beta-glucosyltransferase
MISFARSETPLFEPIIALNQRSQSGFLYTAFSQDHSFTSELVIVNDGSTDDTLQRLRTLSLPPGSNLLSYRRNRGKGYAIKTGMLAAKGNFRLFTDVDLSTPLKEFDKFLLI